uniref:Uncharacterized protein n=1 Tax=Ditylenchus dipsaci TaxID=166011 RepID=A0A915E0J6_9BILA
MKSFHQKVLPPLFRLNCIYIFKTTAYFYFTIESYYAGGRVPLLVGVDNSVKVEYKQVTAQHKSVSCPSPTFLPYRQYLEGGLPCKILLANLQRFV